MLRLLSQLQLYSLHSSFPVIHLLTKTICSTLMRKEKDVNHELNINIAFLYSPKRNIKCLYSLTV